MEKIITTLFTKRRTIGYLKGTKEFTGTDGEDLTQYISEVIIDEDDGINVEISPTTKRIHAHVVLEVRHYAKIGVDQDALKEAMATLLPPELRPETGGAYVYVKLIPATVRYTRKGETTQRMDVASIQRRMLNKKNGEILINKTEELGIIEDLEL